MTPRGFGWKSRLIKLNATNKIKNATEPGKEQVKPPEPKEKEKSAVPIRNNDICRGCHSLALLVVDPEPGGPTRRCPNCGREWRNLAELSATATAPKSKPPAQPGKEPEKQFEQADIAAWYPGFHRVPPVVDGNLQTILTCLQPILVSPGPAGDQTRYGRTPVKENKIWY